MKLFPSCPFTGISFPALLRASHIKSWRACQSGQERLDPFNGIMLV
ncbi:MULTISPECIES: HNH endonuclease signature motif containing protein [Leclercia]